MKFPDAEVLVVLAVVGAAAWAYAQFVDNDAELAKKIFVRVFLAAAVAVAAYTAYVNFAGSAADSFPFDADTKMALDVIP